MKTMNMLPLLARMTHLTMGAPLSFCALAAVAGMATTVIGCADEDDPNTWVKRLDDPAQRTPAIKRLGEFYNDALNKADKAKGKDDPKVKAMLDIVVEPLAKQYLAGNLDEKTRKDLMKNLADMADPRAAPAFAKALSDYEPGKNDEDVKFSAQAAASLAKQSKLTDQALIDALWACFAKFQPSKAKSINLVTDLRDAVITVKHPSYGPKAVDKLSAPVLDPKDPQQDSDQIQFWQATSARLIGLLKFTPGVKTLVTALLTPTKAALGSIIRTALLRMPKDAETALVAAAKGTDADTGALLKNYPNGAGFTVISESLAYLSRPAAQAVLMDKVANTDDDTTLTLVAMNFVHLPFSADVEKSFQLAYTKVDPQTVVALGGGNGRGVLLGAAAHFYDTTLVDWMLKEAAAAKGDAADSMQASGYSAAIKIMTPKNKDAVGAAVNKIVGPDLTKDMYKSATAVLDKCKEDAACYVSFLDQPIPSSPETAKSAFIKACYMAGIFGNDKTRTDLVAKVDKIKDGSVRLAIVDVIEHLAPKGDMAAADVFDKIVETDTNTGNKSLLAADDAVVKVSLILRSRATP
jgi:hypothetical protein